MAPILDKFIQIIEENDLKPDEIEKVVYTPHVVGLNKMWVENELKTEEDYGFHGPYLIACAAYRLKAIDYQAEYQKKNQRIRDFMRKVEILSDYHKDFGPSMLEDPITRVVRVEVSARGKTYEGNSRYVRWGWRPNEVRASDDDLAGKFSEMVIGILSSQKVAKVTQLLLALEDVKNMRTVMELLSP